MSENNFFSGLQSQIQRMNEDLFSLQETSLPDYVQIWDDGDEEKSTEDQAVVKKGVCPVCGNPVNECTCKESADDDDEVEIVDDPADDDTDDDENEFDYDDDSDVLDKSDDDDAVFDAIEDNDPKHESLEHILESIMANSLNESELVDFNDEYTQRLNAVYNETALDLDASTKSTIDHLLAADDAKFKGLEAGPVNFKNSTLSESVVESALTANDVLSENDLTPEAVSVAMVENALESISEDEENYINDQLVLENDFAIDEALAEF